jgi:hypothetical protein
LPENRVIKKERNGKNALAKAARVARQVNGVNGEK